MKTEWMRRLSRAFGYVAPALRGGAWALAVVATLWVSNRAQAQVDAQISELNSQALEAYQALDIDSARSKLEQAVGMAQQAGYVGPVVAQTYMNLGVVLVAGQNDRDQGLAAFLSAVCIQPNVQLDPLLSTPDVQLVFGQAQQDAQGGACGPGAAAAPPPQQAYIQPGPQAMAPQVAGPRMDEECPPGVICNAGEGGAAGPTDWARGFFGVELAAGFALVRTGMKADSKPPPGDIFRSQVVETDSNGDTFIDGNDDEDKDGMPDTATRYLFDPKSAWVPDADSFDDLESVDANTGRIEIPRGITPLSTSCAADGKRSGPTDVKDMKTGMNFTTLEPSRYCVRVVKPGMVTNLAIRLNPGYWITRSFALSIPFRFQFNAGKGSLSHMLIGLRGELMFSDQTKATGFPVSWFFGATYGQIQAKPPPKDPKRPAPYAVSGPFGVHTGVNVRFRIHRNFGFIISPEVDVMVPDFLFNIDLAGGVEGAF
jgi:hypothetical protein